MARTPAGCCSRSRTWWDEHGNPVGGQGPTAAADDPGKGYSRFEDWLASMVELNGGARTPPLVTVDEADRLEPGPDAVLVETRAAPVIDGYTTDGDRMAEVRRDGRTWFVVVRGHGPRAEVIPVDADVLAAPTFEALVAHLETQRRTATRRTSGTSRPARRTCAGSPTPSVATGTAPTTSSRRR
jgi:hypothetical protein